MHIEESLKLDFKDVLIRPKRSTLTSRAQVELEREFVFRHSHRHYRGVPVIAANMDTTGTLEMANALEPHGLSVALHKHYDVETLVRFFTGLQTNRRCFTRWALHRQITKNSPQ
jgi:GMP reductase